jgi:hypothetical protein
MESLTPLPLGRETWALAPSPMTKMLERLARVSKGARSQYGSHVDSPGGEGSVEHVPDVNNVETAEVPLLVDDDTGPPHVTTAGDHADVSGLELDVVDDLVLDKVKLDRVVDLDGRVGVTDGAAVVGDDVGDALGAELVLADLEELEGGLLGGDAVDGESALDVVEETEVLARTLNRDNVHETSGVGLVGADLAVDLDEARLQDRGDLLAGEGVLETVAEEDGEGERLPELVRTGGRAGRLERIVSKSKGKGRLGTSVGDNGVVSLT